MRNLTIISDQEFDELVEKTYGKPYAFQRQDGCRDQNTYYFTVPDYFEDFADDEIPESLNSRICKVTFSAWLDRDPRQILALEKDTSVEDIRRWWEEYFYPDPQMIFNDLCARNILPSGEYGIDVYW